MPNWCHNTLTVEGPAAELRRFAQAVQTEEQPLSFATLVPEPDGLTERPELGLEGLFDQSIPDDQLDWYAWRGRYWGTKWDANFEGVFVALGSEEARVSDPAGLLELNDTLTYSFLTAWGPPAPFVRSAAAQFPELRFVLTYAEPGNGFAGRVVAAGGEPVEDIELDVEDVLAAEDRWF